MQACPEIIHQGWLQKQSKETGALKNWKLRWFVLKGNHLSYFCSPSSSSTPARGVIDLSDTTIIPCDVPEKGENCFVIRHPRRRDFYLQANDVDDLLTWLDCLKGATTTSRLSVGFSWTIAQPCCPLTWHEVKFHWPDTSFPLGIDFVMQHGGAITVKAVHGEARAQAADIEKDEIVVAVNGESVKGWSMEQFIKAVRDAAPGSNPQECNVDNKQISVTIAFTFARKVRKSTTTTEVTAVPTPIRPLPAAPIQTERVSRRRNEKCLSLGRGTKKMVQGIQWNVKTRRTRGSWCHSVGKKLCTH